MVVNWGISVQPTSGHHVLSILQLIDAAESEPEADSSKQGKNSNNAVVPDQERIISQGNQSLGQGGGNGVHEERNSGNEGTHILWCLGEGVLEGGDGCQDFGETDESVWNNLDPDGDRSLLVAFVGLVTAWGHLVDVVLSDGGGDHGQGGEEESRGDTLDWGEQDTHLAKCWVEDEIHEWDKEDDSQWVQVGDNVVWCTAQLHRGSLRSQVVRHLAIRQPVNWVPHEDLTGRDTTTDLIDPSIVKGHPLWLVGAEAGRLSLVPEIWSLGVFVEADWVDRRLSLESQAEELDGLSENGSSWRAQVKSLFGNSKNWDAGGEDDGWQHEREPETHVLLGENHGDGTAKGADVD